MAKQRLKGLWVPAEILLNEELTDKEKTYLHYSLKEPQCSYEKERDLEI